MSSTVSQISAWGNGLAIRLTKPMAKTAGVTEGSTIRVTVKPGRINPFAIAAPGARGEMGYLPLSSIEGLA